MRPYRGCGGAGPGVGGRSSLSPGDGGYRALLLITGKLRPGASRDTDRCSPHPTGPRAVAWGGGAYLFVGALVNASAVAEAVTTILEETTLGLTVIACGERWPVAGDDGYLRVAMEDELGAGAILWYLPFSTSPEAHVCAAGFRAVQDQIEALLWDSASGRQLRQKGWGADVTRAAQLNSSATVPILRQERLEPFHATGSG